MKAEINQISSGLAVVLSPETIQEAAQLVRLGMNVSAESAKAFNLVANESSFTAYINIRVRGDRCDNKSCNMRCWIEPKK